MPQYGADENAGRLAPQGWIVARHAELDSTNSEARRMLEQGFAGRAAVVADRQSAGRGRMGRVWDSPGPLGLWVSLLMPVSRPPEELPRAALVLATAVRSAALLACGVELKIKWPNDLLDSAGRKCCGLLPEAAFTPGSAAPDRLILGIGLNINQRERHFAPELRGRAASLRMNCGRALRRMEILLTVIASVQGAFALWEERGFAAARQAWLDGNCTLGREIIAPGGIAAVAEDLAPDGALLAREAGGGLRRIDAGEILFNN